MKKENKPKTDSKKTGIIIGILFIAQFILSKCSFINIRKFPHLIVSTYEGQLLPETETAVIDQRLTFDKIFIMEIDGKSTDQICNERGFERRLQMGWELLPGEHTITILIQGTFFKGGFQSSNPRYSVKFTVKKGQIYEFRLKKGEVKRERVIYQRDVYEADMRPVTPYVINKQTGKIVSIKLKKLN
ncbi:MAG: hypothetical protein ACETWK_04425 [Candidatus Aminicenantaceae bacterium]